MPGRDIIVIGASAGGIEALTGLIAALPVDLPAAVFDVLHVSSHGRSVLPEILNRRGALPAVHPADGEEILPGRIYVAPSDRHLLVKPRKVRIARGPRENGHRPAVDPLFRTAARAYGPRVVGVVLSGSLDDGTGGLLSIVQQGGLALVQNPNEALYPSMPRSALENVPGAEARPVVEIAEILDRLAREPRNDRQADEVTMAKEEEIEADMAELEPHAMHHHNRPGTPSGFGCPDCGGVLWEIEQEGHVRFRCRVGHSWTANSLLAQQSDELEEALWVALRALEERATLADRVAERMRTRGNDRSAERFQEQAADATRRAGLIRQFLCNEPQINDEPIPSLGPPIGSDGGKAAEAP